MTRFVHRKIPSAAVLLPVVFAAWSTIASAQTTKIQGMIKSRSGATMMVQLPDTKDSVVVLLTDSTQVGQIQGVFQARRKDMSMAALIPGLEVQVEGAYNGLNQLVAKVVKFKGNDLERAQSIQAGLHETKAQSERNREEIEKQQAELKAQAEKLKAEQEKVAVHETKIAESEAKIAANQARINEAIARFGQLDDYYILDEVTVLFANGKTVVEAQYKPQLLQLAQKAKTVEGYMVQVTGYASSTGSVTVNQKLSADRAANVTNVLMQQGDIPLTNLLAPGAMGESRQVGNPKTAEGEAQNRRVVVRVLQNKGIAGLQSMR